MAEQFTQGQLINELDIVDIINYLVHQGWTSSSPSDKWLVFRGRADAADPPIEIVFPQNPQAPDIRKYVANAVEILSALLDQDSSDVIESIKLYDHDLLRIRNLDTNGESSISLRLAYRQITEVNRLIAWSAYSERHPRPYFRPGLASPASMPVTEHFRFGHTFLGSFGFVIEAPVVIRQRTVIQHPIFADADTADLVLPPLERRIMERIIRGLLRVKRVPQDHDVKALLEGYTTGFNSNMYQALLGMAPKNRAPLEYSIRWSSVVRPSEDVQPTEPIRLTKINYEYLGYAAQELKKVRPEPVVIRGHVESLSATDNPRGLGTERSVIVRWENRPDSARSIKVVMGLEGDAYVLAHQAHIDWATIEVTGELGQTGTILRLWNPKNFRIV